MKAEFLLDTDHLITGRIRRHDEGRYALLARVGIGDGKNDDHLAVLARSDELLCAVDHVMITIAPCACLEVRGVGTGLRFGQRKTADPLAGRKTRQKALLLFFRPEFEDRHAADRTVDTHDRRARSVAGGDFLHRRSIGEHAGIGTAIGIRHQHAEQPERTHFLQFLARKPVLAVPFRSARRQPLAGKTAGHFADLLLGFRKDHRPYSRQDRSMAMAVASPPPMQSAAMPRFRS
ncbi:hypothetical protein D3C73_776100 [compost metagenome]